MPSEKTVTKCSETRRSTKPIMEKRRRARINNSLSELKNLILDALKKDNARHSKLEKADILEMTVKHLQSLQMQQMTPDPSTMAKFRSGFAECANEVNRFMGRVDGVDPTIRQRLLNHLANCLTGMNNPPPTPLPPVHVQVGATTAPESEPRLLSGVQLVPTRLPSGEIAFLLPAQVSVYAPSTVPISPASSTSSVTSPMSITSSTSSPSPVNVLGSSGILSPAASDRCSPSPVMHTRVHSPVMHTRVNSPVMHTRVHPETMVSHCPVIVPHMNHHKVESKAVWRPF
ncbi:transcription factor HES-4-A-like [Uloborus diversus]|uniref:transcription factor HES-4-A-like n=1 Tax=Uloborus diversus TaxID=327109 RepID=UPI00240A4CA3|nr:transcription factor HES-4-A-like [Uloborus diversus]